MINRGNRKSELEEKLRTAKEEVESERAKLQEEVKELKSSLVGKEQEISEMYCQHVGTRDVGRKTTRRSRKG